MVVFFRIQFSWFFEHSARYGQFADVMNSSGKIKLLNGFFIVAIIAGHGLRLLCNSQRMAACKVRFEVDNFGKKSGNIVKLSLIHI